jgi:hypothetical protein
MTKQRREREGHSVCRCRSPCDSRKDTRRMSGSPRRYPGCGVPGPSGSGWHRRCRSGSAGAGCSMAWALGGLAVVQRLIQRAGQPPQKEDGDKRPARTDGGRVHDGTWLGRPASQAANRSSCCVAWRALICSLTHCGFLASCLATQSGCALISDWTQSG